MKLISLLPFMESNELKDLALKIINGEVKGVKLVMLYPFLDREGLDEVVEVLIEKGEGRGLTHALPFMSKVSVQKIYEGIKDGSIKGVKEHMLIPFLGKSQVKDLFDDLVKKAQENSTEDSDDFGDDDLEDELDEFEDEE